MNAPFAAQFDATVGGAAFQLEGYTLAGDPVLDAEGTRYGTKLVYQMQGTLWATDAGDLPGVLDAFEASCETDGADLTITGSAETLEFLDASECIEGPTVKFGYGGDRGDNYQSVTVTVEAVRAVDPNADGILSAITEASRHQFNFEAFETIVYRGSVRTTGTPAASLVVLTGSGGIGGIGPMIPARPAGWQRVYGYEVNDADTECSWEATLTELTEAYPDDDVSIVDGERTISTEYDEHNREVTRYAYTYVGPGAEAWMEARHTFLRAAGGLMRASISVAAHKTVSVSGTFEVLTGRDATSLLALVETISHARSGPLLREARYPGTTPLIVQEAEPGYVYQQTGRAVGRAAFPEAPPLKFAVANLVDKEIVPTRTSDVEYEVAWRYTFLFATIQNITLPSGRGDSGGFYAGGEGW